VSPDEVQLELTDEKGRRRLEREGYRRETELLCMTIPLEPPPGPPVWPDGVTVRTWRDGDGPAVHALLVAAFERNREEVPPYGEWLPSITEDEEFDPGTCVLAECDEGLAGVALCWSSGFVKDVAVGPSWRRRGLGEALLRHAFAEFRARGHTEVSLKVDADNPTGAVRLYERVGMHVERRLELWARRPGYDRRVPAFELQGLDHVAIVAADQERSIAWYRDVLGLERVHEDVWGSMPAMLVVPATQTGIAIFPLRSGSGGPPGEGVRIAHVAFRVDRASFDAAREALAARGLDVEWQDHERSHSIYFSDPDGHRLELTTYDV
jgi:ribosomal protein S18 acetylase RimI-like enzyme